ncbi:MAG TPA: alpha-glucan family phosphorylase [Pirellulales bacterium]|jgi:starch phosphorylase|nr:alpha-glucan family phosphorylase [Pirellulales bacterium]
MSTNVIPADGSLLWTPEEINHLVSHNGTPAKTLDNIVQMIQHRFETDVCSVYLLEPDRANLVLAATVGLRPDSVGRVRMRLDEGLAGLVAEQFKPLMVEDAARHPRFKYFRESGEDQYRSFLGVPLVDRGLLQGVLIVQTAESRTFSEEEMQLMVDAGAQLGPLISETRMLEQFVAPSYHRLWALARNLWWSWDHESATLFRDLDPVRWRQVDHNPIALLEGMSIEMLEQRASQLVLHSRINYTFRRMQEYLNSTKTWGARHAGVLWARPVAYFSAEFGLHESVPIYSGGLGILSGDHIKSASDLGIPLIGVGLYYNQGYFRQRLDIEGWQQEDYLHVNDAMLPVQPAMGKDGQPVLVRIQTRSAEITARVMRVSVGRNALLLLDSDVDGNQPEDRELTSRLYGGDNRVRIRQELLLGVGGVRALRAMGISPGVVHLNEGHSAFASLELVRQRMAEEGLRLDEAIRRVACQTVFTTHTPVPAGHDRFSAHLIDEHLGPIRDAMGMAHDHLMALGRVDPYNPGEDFCMTVLALKLSRRANAVSSLHGQVSRSMWTGLWSNRPEEEVPIGHITNGVHVPTWLAPQMRQVYDRHLGSDWPVRASEASLWDTIDTIDDGELWETHQALKARLLNFVRRLAVRQAERRGEGEEALAQLRRALSYDALTIGFARRFATYKRATLIFEDIERIAALVNDPQMPIQFVFAGKAHPHDGPGKKLLQYIARLTRDARFLGKVVFVEDYDINVGRHFVQGVDVWLNNPRRPLEASGTSGEKVVLNGGLNLSILDGWWAEAYDGSNGFAIGGGETHTVTDVHDSRDQAALLSTLTNEVIPLYYRRDRDGIPRAWIKRMKRAIRTMGWRFSADRMVIDYVLKSYIPAAGGTSSDMTRM